MGMERKPAHRAHDHPLGLGVAAALRDLHRHGPLARRRSRTGGGALMAARGAITDETTLRLWVQAGGRCQYHGCNEYLLEDELTTYTLNLAERAHIVGATDAPRSPRGDAPLPLARRNQVENL